jgi:predicted DNA-binding transcriptional regulator AlpA
MDKVTLISITVDELKELIREAVREELSAREQKPDEKMLSINEVCKMFHPSVTRATVHNWSKRGLLKKYYIGRSVRFKYSEIMEAAKHLKKYKSIH